MIKVSDRVEFPTKVSIGGILYDVVIVEDLKLESTGARLDGHIVYAKNEIRLDSKLDPQAMWQVMIHEIIHGILTQSGRDAKEDIVDAIAYGALGFIQANDWIIK
jgi:hypothetical protein